jgi:hypothetical protein
VEAVMRGEVVTTAKKSGQRKAALQISASFGPSFVGDSDWRSEEKKRLKDEIAEIDKELANFDHKKAGERVKESLSLERKRKELRLQEHELEKK